jgi:hypothetical protein
MLIKKKLLKKKEWNLRVICCTFLSFTHQVQSTTKSLSSLASEISLNYAFSLSSVYELGGSQTPRWVLCLWSCWPLHSLPLVVCCNKKENTLSLSDEQMLKTFLKSWTPNLHKPQYSLNNNSISITKSNFCCTFTLCYEPWEMIFSRDSPSVVFNFVTSVPSGNLLNMQILRSNQTYRYWNSEGGAQAPVI